MMPINKQHENAKKSSFNAFFVLPQNHHKLLPFLAEFEQFCQEPGKTLRIFNGVVFDKIGLSRPKMGIICDDFAAKQILRKTMIFPGSI